jgi:hypothetical protein
MDIAHALIGKGDSNNSIYIKLFKLLFNLFMDIVMDRMAKREDTAADQITFVPILPPRPHAPNFLLRNRLVS